MIFQGVDKRVVAKFTQRVVNPPLVCPPFSEIAEWPSLIVPSGPHKSLLVLLRMLRTPDVTVWCPHGFAWTNEVKGPAGIVLNSLTGVVYYDKERIAENFEEAIALFRKRAVRIKYGIDPPAEVYELRKRQDRNRRRSLQRSRQRAACAKLAVPQAERQSGIAEGEKPSTPALVRDPMDLIREMVGR